LLTLRHPQRLALRDQLGLLQRHGQGAPDGRGQGQDQQGPRVDQGRRGPRGQHDQPRAGVDPPEQERVDLYCELERVR
jgi:hypothetical protein